MVNPPERALLIEVYGLATASEHRDFQSSSYIQYDLNSIDMPRPRMKFKMINSSTNGRYSERLVMNEVSKQYSSLQRV